MYIPGKIEEYMVQAKSTEERKQLFGEQITSLRKKVGLTQKEVCEIIGVTPQTYSGYEKGKYEPTMETLVRLSLLYGVTINHLVCGWVDKDDETESTIDNEFENYQIEALRNEVLFMKHELEEMKRWINRG